MRRLLSWTPCVLLLLLASACQSREVTVAFNALQDDIARFDLRNPTDRPLQTVTLELTYLSAENTSLQVDTIRYQMSATDAGDAAPFLEAGGETFITEVVPPQTASASARVPEVTHPDAP